MSTGFETWTQDLNNLSELYPFVGTEVVLAWAGIAAWVLWHIFQIRSENTTLEEEKTRFSDKTKLAKAMQISNAETLRETLKDNAAGF